jgi:lipopolysaccharide transport system ATP-binding protein
MRGRVAALIELNAGFAPILTGRENIFNQAALLGFSHQETVEKFDAIVDFADIGDFLDMPVQNYSSGMRVRLGFAVAAQMEPDILIIDEVLAVGDVAFRFKCLNAIGDLLHSAAVIFVSHTMPQIFRICTEAMVLNHGKVTYSGDVAQGVATYLSLFEGADATLAGTGEVKVEDFSLQSSSSESHMAETLTVQYGSPLKISARIRVAPGVPQVAMQFVLWNAEMLPVLDVVNEKLSGFIVDVPPSGVVDVSAELPRTELNGGKYSISVMANTPDYTRALCRHDNVGYLQVNAGTDSGAHVLSIGNWSA